MAEAVDLSAQTISDIEGFRTWVSDKTLIKLALALETDIYQLFISSSIQKDEIYKTVVLDLVKILQKIKKDIDFDFEKALKIWGLDNKE